MNESQLTDVMERAVAPLEPDIEGIVARARSRGRALARHRRAVVAVGATTVVAVLGAGIAIVPTLVSGSDSLVAQDPGVTATPRRPLLDAGGSPYGLTVGSPDAPHSVVIYEDFLCPYCQQFEEATGERLQELAEEGKVYLDYRPFHLLEPDYSVEAANAFWVVQQVAGDAVALRFHNLLYYCPDGDHASTSCNQPSEENPTVEADGEPVLAHLVDLAVEAGAQQAAVRPGIEARTLDTTVTAATKEAEDAGVDGTPTIFLDGQPFQEGTTMAELGENLLAAVS